MEANLQRRIQRYGWDKAADQYEAGWKDSLAPAQEALMELASPRPGERVLDMACGTGLVTFPMASAVGRDGHVVASDISERMVEIIQADAAFRGVHQIDAVRADAEQHDMIADESVDLVTCALGLMYVPDSLAAIREAFRVLKPGGRAVFAVWGRQEELRLGRDFPIVDMRVKSEVCPLFFRLGTGDQLAREMTRAGLQVTDNRRISSSMPYRDDEEALRAAFAGGPVALAYRRFDEAMRAAAHEDYLASIANWKAGSGYRIPSEFRICAGRK